MGRNPFPSVAKDLTPAHNNNPNANAQRLAQLPPCLSTPNNPSCESRSTQDSHMLAPNFGVNNTTSGEAFNAGRGTNAMYTDPRVGNVTAGPRLNAPSLMSPGLPTVYPGSTMTPVFHPGNAAHRQSGERGREAMDHSTPIGSLNTGTIPGTLDAGALQTTAPVFHLGTGLHSNFGVSAGGGATYGMPTTSEYWARNIGPGPIQPIRLVGPMPAQAHTSQRIQLQGKTKRGTTAGKSSRWFKVYMKRFHPTVDDAMPQKTPPGFLPFKRAVLQAMNEDDIDTLRAMLGEEADSEYERFLHGNRSKPSRVEEAADDHRFDAPIRTSDDAEEGTDDEDDAKVSSNTDSAAAAPSPPIDTSAMSCQPSTQVVEKQVKKKWTLEEKNAHLNKKLADLRAIMAKKSEQPAPRLVTETSKSAATMTATTDGPFDPSNVLLPTLTPPQAILNATLPMTRSMKPSPSTITGLKQGQPSNDSVQGITVQTAEMIDNEMKAKEGEKASKSGIEAPTKLVEGVTIDPTLSTIMNKPPNRASKSLGEREQAQREEEPAQHIQQTSNPQRQIASSAHYLSQAQRYASHPSTRFRELQDRLHHTEQEVDARRAQLHATQRRLEDERDAHEHTWRVAQNRARRIQQLEESEEHLGSMIGDLTRRNIDLEGRLRRALDEAWDWRVEAYDSRDREKRYRDGRDGYRRQERMGWRSGFEYHPRERSASPRDGTVGLGRGRGRDGYKRD